MIIDFDFTQNPIHIGDVIIDADGRRYTIDEWGRAITDGGKLCKLDDLQEVVVVRAAKPNEPKLQTFTPNAKPTETPVERRRRLQRACEARYRERNREKIADKQRARRASLTPEQHEAKKLAEKQYYYSHREEILEKQRTYRAANKGKRKVQNAKYYQENREKMRAYHKEYYLRKKKANEESQK